MRSARIPRGLTSGPPKRSVQLIRRRLRCWPEEVLGHLLTLCSQMLHSHRHEARRGVITHRFALRAHTDLLESEKLLELHVAILDAGDLGHADDTPHTTTQSGLLHDHVDGRPDRLADGP